MESLKQETADAHQATAESKLGMPEELSAKSGTVVEVEGVEVEVEVTTKKERIAWILYDFANSGFVGCGLAFAIPLLLDSLAWDAGSSYPLPSTSSNSSSATDASALPDFSTLPSDWFQTGSCIKGARDLPTTSPFYYDRCVVPWAGSFIRHSSWTFNNISISVGIQAFIFLSLSSLADHGPYRKRFMIAGAYVGALFALLMMIPTAGTYYLGGVFGIIANVAAGTSLVFYNAYLPVLSRADPDVVKASIQTEGDLAGEDAQIRKERQMRIAEAVSSRLSAHGFGIGYIASVVCVAIGALLYSKMEERGLKITIAITGVWWAVFTIPVALWLKTRPGPDFPAGENWVLYSWKTIFNTIRLTPRIPRTTLFLLSYLIFSDGLTTLVSTILLFAQNELRVPQTTLGILFIISLFCSVIGMYTAYTLQSFLQTSPKQMLLACLGLYTLLCAYSLLGLSTSISIGLKQRWELYLFAVINGLLMGPTQSYTRVIYAELIPPGRE
ncbi:Autophagy protein 22, partial [Quaeritorhiza haematococci]